VCVSGRVCVIYEREVSAKCAMKVRQSDESSRETTELKEGSAQEKQVARGVTKHWRGVP
jgi:hypothetical protein